MKKRFLCAWKGERRERRARHFLSECVGINLDTCATEMGIVWDTFPYIRSPYSRSEAWKLLPFYCCPPSLAPRFSAHSSHTHILPFAGGKKYRRLLSQNVAKIYIDWKTCAKGGRDEEYLNILLSLGELLWHAHTNMHAAHRIYIPPLGRAFCICFWSQKLENEYFLALLTLAFY